MVCYSTGSQAVSISNHCAWGALWHGGKQPKERALWSVSEPKPCQELLQIELQCLCLPNLLVTDIVLKLVFVQCQEVKGKQRTLGK